MNWEFIGFVLGIVFLILGASVLAIGLIRWRRHRRNPMRRDEATFSLLWLVPGSIVFVAGLVCILFATT